MQYNIYDLFNQAKNFKKSTPLIHKDEESYIYKGIKICKMNDQIILYNTFTDKMEYNLLTKEQCDILFEKGFEKGIKILTKSRYEKKIERLNECIREEVNSRNNRKHYQRLKSRRETLINKYSKLSNN